MAKRKSIVKMFQTNVFHPRSFSSVARRLSRGEIQSICTMKRPRSAGRKQRSEPPTKAIAAN